MGSETSLQGYWRVYGGIISVVRSTYFWVAAIITVMFPDLWKAENADKELVWAQLAIDILPSLLGFAVGGMAIMLAFSSGRFLEAIRQKGKDDSYFRKVMASFYHFSLVLTIALIVAFVSKVISVRAISAIGVFFTLYGILLIMGIVSRVWHTARIFNKVRENDNAT